MKKLRDFSCDKCTHKFESFVEDSQVMLSCIKCGSEAYRRLSAPKCFQNTVGKSPSVKGQIVKIVKFKDGKYGVRRFNWSILEFEFLDRDSFYWFIDGGCIFKHCHFDSIEKCNKVFSAFKDIEARKKKDIGKPIANKQHCINEKQIIEGYKMNECTLEDIKYGRSKAKVIKEAESPQMRKKMDTMRLIEDRKNAPKITDREYFDELFDSL